MALQFQPYPGAKTKREQQEQDMGALESAGSRIPSTILAFQQFKIQKAQQDLQMQQLRQQMEILKRESEAKYGTGVAENVQPGQLVSAPPPTAGPEEQMFGFEATPPTFTEETPEQKLRRMGTEGFNAETARIKAEQEKPNKTQLKVTDKNVPLLYDPVSGSINVQATGEPYDPAAHGNIVVPGAPPVLPPNQNVEITDITSARKQLRDLIDGAAESGFGEGNPYIERARTNPLNPLQLLDPKAQKFKQLTAATKQIIGKGLEGGVLRKEDESKYDAIIPKPGDTTEILRAKASQLDKLLDQKQRERIGGFSSAGFRGIPGAAELPPISQGQPQNRPQVGAEEDGYRFKGGNPADPNSWEKI